MIFHLVSRVVRVYNYHNITYCILKALLLPIYKLFSNRTFEYTDENVEKILNLIKSMKKAVFFLR